MGTGPRTSTLGVVTSGFLHDKHLPFGVLQVISGKDQEITFQLLGRMAESPGRAKQPVTLSYSCPCATLQAWCCRVSRAPLSSPGSSEQEPYPRELKTTMLVYLKNSVLFALRNASIEPLLLLSSFALPVLLLPRLCYSMSYHFLLLYLQMIV